MVGPGKRDNHGAGEEKYELGEFEKFGVDRGEGEGDKNAQEVEGGGNDRLHGKSIAESCSQICLCIQVKNR